MNIICSKCGVEKPRDHFSDRADRPCGKRSACKACEKARQSLRNPTRRAKYHNGAERARHLMRFYKMTPEEFDRRLSSQGGVCALCDGSGPWVVDHDHSCCPGRYTCGSCVRGILCSPCNLLLGRVEGRNDMIVRIGRYSGRA